MIIVKAVLELKHEAFWMEYTSQTKSELRQKSLKKILVDTRPTKRYDATVVYASSTAQ